MKFAPVTLRRIEMALWILGVCLVGGASGATFSRWNYQVQQERALFGEPAVVSRTASITAAPQTTAVTPPIGARNESRTPAKSVEVTRSRSLLARRTDAPMKRARLADPNAVGRLEIPSVGVAAIVRIGTDDNTLARAVGLVTASPRPGQGGNTVLAGHRDTFFRPLRDVKVNDRIRLVSPGETYEYRVKSVFIVGPEDTGVLRSKGVEELTLVTCYPFRFVGTAPERFIVNATRVN